MTNTAHNVNLFCGFVDDFQAAVGNCVNADRGGANRRVGLCNALLSQKSAHSPVFFRRSFLPWVNRCPLVYAPFCTDTEDIF